MQVDDRLVPRLCDAGAGDRLVIGPTSAEILVGEEHTGGRSSAIEFALEPGFGGPPVHVHRRFDHIWYVLEGALRVQIGDERRVLGPGACAFVPRGTPHGFANASGERTRFLEVDSPAAAERYLRELARAFPSGNAVDQARVAEIQRRHDTEPVA